MPRGKPHDVEASAGVTCQYPGPTLLPSPIAHAVSLATRSTSLAIRIGSLVGCYSLDAARFTTLSSLGLARGLVETVLSTAAHDTVSLSQSDLGAAETETILERSLESLHFAVTQIVFWTSAGFRLTGTTISTASDASQLLLGSLDKLFGSTDSSRAVASIITLVRREFNNPATGVGGEKVGVSDLVVALGALAYLQRASRRQASEEARRHAYEEVIWDVVVLTDGERIDVRGDEENESQLTPRNDHDPNDLGIRYGAGEDDEAVMQRLKSHITANLEPGTTASISNSVSSVQTITVDVKGPQLLSLPTPPGAEIVETRSASASAGNHRQWSFGPDNDTSYTVVYRIQRDKFRSATFRGEEEESGPAVVEVTDDDPVPTAEPLKRLAPASKSLSDITSLNGKESQRSSSTPSSTAGSPSHASNTNGPFEAPKPLRPSQSGGPETTANQKKQRTPPIEPLSRSSSAKKRTADSSRRSQPKKKAETLSTGKQSEKRPGLKQVLKDSGQSLSNMWNKEGPDHEPSRSVVKQRPQWKGTGGSTSESSNKLKPPAGRTQPQKAQRNVPARRVQTPDPFPRPSSRASYVSIHERRRDSVVSLTDAYSRNSTTGLRPASPTIFRTDYSTQETVSRTPGEPYPVGPVPPSPHGNGHHHRRSTSYAPSLYSLATNDSQSSLLLASYYQKSAYNTSSALNTLRNEGFVDGTFPTGHLLPNIARYMRYSSACYGSHFMKLLACRGTLGFEDVLADLTCDYDNLLWRGRAYRVHKGVHASARRLLFGDDGRVLVTLKEALLEFPDYGLVLCGHSLGGGVTSLLGVMLSEPNPDGPGFVISAEPYSKLLTQGLGAGHKFSDVRLPQSRRIHVYAYGPPGILSPSLRKITRGLITTVVHGNDIVPHLSLGVLHDFQGLALAFKKDENHTKAEIRRRMWQAFQEHLSDKWYQATPAAPKEGDEEWVLPMLQALRGTMKGKKLVPPGEVFAIETTRVLRRDAFVKQEEGPIGRPARRVVLKYIRDVEGRFDEIRFGAGLLTDHSPAKYEDALNKLRLGVVE
ncbi:Sn1-specific diacylglycerol lipase beta [Metarhizium anisopliae]